MKRIFFLVTLFIAQHLFAEAPIVLKNQTIQVTVDPSTARFSVMDLRSGQGWNQTENNNARLSDVKVSGTRLTGVLNAPNGVKLQIDMELPGDQPELAVTLSGDANSLLIQSLAYPYPFLPHDKDLFILPEHEGVGIPVTDFSIFNNKYSSDYVGAPVYNKLFRFYCGHDLSMTFWGYAGEKSSCMGIVETPDDASLRMQTLDGKLAGGIEWEPSRSKFGYNRTIRYVFFGNGGYNAICKRYREYAFKTGLLKTIEEKAKTNPNVARFARSALMWIFSPDTDVLVPQMLKAGMTQLAVTSPIFTPGEVCRMNEKGVLNGVYDCTRSVLPPEFMDKVFRMDPCDVREAYPSDIILMQNGAPFDYGWPKNGYGGKVYRTLDVCDLKQAGFAAERLQQQFEYRPMSIRFYDTITAFPWTECYDTNHPTTRSQVRCARMAVLKQASEDYKQVVGGESGHIYAAPYATYFEGLNHSRFFYYEIKGHPLEVYDHSKEIPQIYRDAMHVEYKYRLPLWELVAHDCCVAHTRWNTPNNKIHSNEWWNRADLWNILYGTPPMYMFFSETEFFWKTYKDRYLQSYQNVVVDVLSKVAGQEMIRHEYLTADQSVQRTTFANGVQVIVNFGANPVELNTKTVVGANSFSVTESAK